MDDTTRYPPACDEKLPLEREWQAFDTDDTLSGLGGDNAAFQVPMDGGHKASIDPQILGGLLSPAAAFDQDLMSLFEPTFPVETLSEALNLHQSIEFDIPQQPHSRPTYLHHHLHHRSVSEPPGGLGNFRFQPLFPKISEYTELREFSEPPAGAEPQVFFHRQGHLLGTPKGQLENRMKIAKAHARREPYPTRSTTKVKVGYAGMSATHAAGAPTSAPSMKYAGEVDMSGRFEAPNIVPREIAPHRDVRSQDRIPDPAIESEPKNGMTSIPMPNSSSVAGLAIDDLRAIINEAVRSALRDSGVVGTASE